MCRVRIFSNLTAQIVKFVRFYKPKLQILLCLFRLSNL
ncbi:hypothetical protein CAMRE0001_1243 [Campylobacter rectus RM3267]|uniref:Uncharacterized protein n=1 Tax=Campylobacter rectus RM3267 TaxID=553218 RepID=B9D0N4_CAMRE|nr:hypothetical protein CAMRE0001_1243 [Campylobacter rectus RM3267]